MDFFEHLDKEFAYSKEAFLYALEKLPSSKTIVINIGISSFYYNTGFLNIRNLKNFIKDVSELINSSFKRNVVIVISDSLEMAKYRYAFSSSISETVIDKEKSVYDNLSINSGLYSALVALTHNDIVDPFYDGFADYNLRAIGFSVSAIGSDATGELNKTLKGIESIVFSKFKDDSTKIHAVRELLNSKKNITQASAFNLMAKKTAETIKGIFRNFPGTVPIIMEDVSQKDVKSEDDEGFAAKIAMMINADVVVSVSRKGMLYTIDPDLHNDPPRFYCFDTSRKEPFSEARRSVLAKKLNAAKRVNAHKKPIPLVLTPYNIPYTICKIFDFNEIDNICKKGECPTFTLFVNSKNPSLPIEARHISGVVTVDENAERALIENKSSLLSVGVIDVQGDFPAKSVILIINREEVEVGRGVTNCDSNSIKDEIGVGGSIEIINRTKMRLAMSEANG